MSLKLTAVIYFAYITLALIGNTSSGNLELTVLDVGQGDAILIKTPHNRTILIDGGGDYEASRHLSSYFSLGECYLDLVILSHPHADHLAGLTRILETCAVSQLAFNADYVSEFVQGEKILLDGVTLHFLWPPEDYTSSDLNNLSVIILLDYGEFEALLTGDAPSQILTGITIPKHLIDGHLEVYKVPHHGSRHSFSSTFLEELLLDQVIISVGTNSFGHPSADYQKHCADRNCSVYRTDLDGTVKVVYNANNGSYTTTTSNN